MDAQKLVPKALVSPGRVARPSRLGRVLAFADTAALALAVLVAFDSVRPPIVATVAAMVTLAVTWSIGATIYGLYVRDEQRPDHSTADDVPRVLLLVTICAWSLVGVLSLIRGGGDVRMSFIVWAVAGPASIVFRGFARAAARRHPSYVQNTVIVGAGEVGQLVGRKLLQHPEFGLRLVGFVDADPRTMRGDLQRIPILGEPASVLDIVQKHAIRRVIVAFSNDRHDLQLELVRSLRDHNVQIDLVPRLFEAVGPEVGMHAVEGLPLVALSQTQPLWAARRAKRLIDIVVASAILALFTPSLVAIAILVKLDSPGPVLFRQRRLGQAQKEFTLVKFRTMVVGADHEPHRNYVRNIMNTAALPNANNLYKLERPLDVTRVGGWLRKTSLDELPQLLNVLRGDMSLVGPRPCIPYEVELYESHHFDRFLVPAGMTGFWQVAARAHATFKEALDLDAAYARSWSLRLDLWLLARTPGVLLRQRETA